MIIHLDAISAFIIAVCVGTSIVTAFEVGFSRARSKGRSRLANDAALVAKSRFRHFRWLGRRSKNRSG